VSIRWKSFASADDVRRLLERRLPRGSSPDDVQRFAAAERLECSVLIDGVIYCSAPAPGGGWFLFTAKWLMEFHFTGGRLDSLTVKKGRTGP
jgi:hypothetical protein